MNSFIEEFYYGNIDPQARSSEQNKKVQHDMQTLNESEDFLTDKLSGEEKKRFLKYVDAWAAVNGESTLDSFITGFRLGAQFAFDTFVTSKAPYTDYLKDEIWSAGTVQSRSSTFTTGPRITTGAQVAAPSPKTRRAR